MKTATPTDFRAWMADSLDPDEIADLARYGASAGWPGLTYYRDTTALYEAHEDEIWEALAEDAADFGHPGPVEFVATLNGTQTVETDVQWRNLLVWYMAERTARRMADE